MKEGPANTSSKSVIPSTVLANVRTKSYGLVAPAVIYVMLGVTKKYVDVGYDPNHTSAGLARPMGLQITHNITRA
jgi:hypothetical protein